MVDSLCGIDSYRTPSNEILQYRKEFYRLCREIDDQHTTLLHRIQDQIGRCEFPSMISREYLLIDKFMCELDDDEKELMQKERTWTLVELTVYLSRQKVLIYNLKRNAIEQH